MKQILTKTFLKKEYLNKHKSAYLIADENNYNYMVIYRLLENYGIERRNSNSDNIQYSKILTKVFLIKEYIVNKKPMQQIAKNIGCSYTVIRKYIIKHGIQIRDGHELNRGKDNNLYKDGRYSKPYYCKCGRKICYKTWKDGGGRCNFCSQNGTDHWNWKNGASFEPYPLGWTKTFKEQIRYRDEYRCQICGCHEVECLKKLDVHHIDYDKDNLKPDNLMSLCHSCHMKTNYNREIYIEYFGILKETISEKV